MPIWAGYAVGLWGGIIAYAFVVIGVHVIKNRMQMRRAGARVMTAVADGRLR